MIDGYGYETPCAREEDKYRKAAPFSWQLPDAKGQPRTPHSNPILLGRSRRVDGRQRLAREMVSMVWACDIGGFDDFTEPKGHAIRRYPYYL